MDIRLSPLLSHYYPQLLFIACSGALLQLEERAQKVIPLIHENDISHYSFDDKTNLLTAFFLSNYNLYIWFHIEFFNGSI